MVSISGRLGVLIPAEIYRLGPIPNGPAGKEIGKDLYKGRPMPYILRALSLVPDECRSNMVLESCQYAELGRVLDFSYNHYDSLSRPQVEIIAGRVSALNECFY